MKPSLLVVVAGVVVVVPVSAMLNCKELVVDGHKFDLGALAGPHTVVTHEYSPPSYYNTTYTLDICAPLKRKGDVPKGLECPNGARVCAIKHTWDPESHKTTVAEVIPVAGDLSMHGGKTFDWEAKRLSTSDSKDDAQKEGVRVVLKGGIYKQREQRAVVEFRCNRNLTGTEGEWKSEDEYVPGEQLNERDDGDKKEGDDDKKEGDGKEGNGDPDEEGTPEKQFLNDGAALIWEGYTPAADGNVDTLWLTWYTKYACESQSEGGDKDKTPVETTPEDEARHWGFFTWAFILVFLAIASYLIFGSWLNYNRYGARGWDLLPHGDTIRDVPYLLKDWIRRVLNTVQSSGSRGGYSAV
ncbi:autophagy-related protein 27 [Diplogelasinospora grovesii]|uniref:Autophagy-related protein 27 n=1 Tax=Diplogelasinospora grovesii TaxID=303347 RepID=A0AAN6S8L6_9PEZI|nr:autophagy-related protein 27 [Diplogelasinospora grovesii]